MRLKIAQIQSARQSLPFISNENAMLSLICISQALTVRQVRKKRGGKKKEEIRKKICKSVAIDASLPRLPLVNLAVTLQF